MNEFNVAVCDDEDYYIADIKKYVVAFESESETKLNIYEYNSGLELLQDMQNSGVKFHIVFLDVDMPEYSGIDTAIELRKTDKNVVICFETSYEQYAYEAYQVEALGYIVKPVKYVELKKLLERAIINIRYCIDEKQADEKYLEVKTNKDSKLVEIKDIIYIEKRKNQCIFHLMDGELVCYETLGNIYGKLDVQQFYYSHQGYIVNFSKIKEVKKGCVCFSESVEAPVSRKYYTSLRKMHMDKILRIRQERQNP